MSKLNGKCKYGMWLLSTVAIVFGILTIKSGGQVLFGNEVSRAAAGNYVPFVLWFNFTAGFFYILAGVGLHLQNKASVILPWVLASSTLVVFAALGLHIQSAGLFEMRTVYAMSLRSGIWLIVSFFVYMKFWRTKKG